MRSATASILLILAMMGCSSAPEPESSGSPPGAKPARRANPLLGAGLPAADERSFAGEVVEQVPAGGYTYVAVDRGQGDTTWVATMGIGDAAEVGTRVRVEGFAAQDEFHSRRLDRRFDRIVFGVVERDAG